MAGTRNRKPKISTEQKPVMRLTDQHTLFIDAYTSDPRRNAKAAAIKAGVPEKTAATVGCTWLNQDVYPLIAREIEKRLEVQRNQSQVTAQDVINELRNIAFFDPADMLRPDGKGFLDLKDMPTHVRRALANIGISFSEDANVDPATQEVTFSRLKHIHVNPYNKLQALGQIATLLGMNDDNSPLKAKQGEATIKINFDDFIRALGGKRSTTGDPLAERIARDGGSLPVPPGNASAEAPANGQPLVVVNSNDPPEPRS